MCGLFISLSAQESELKFRARVSSLMFRVVFSTKSGFLHNSSNIAVASNSPGSSVAPKCPV